MSESGRFERGERRREAGSSAAQNGQGWTTPLPQSGTDRASTNPKGTKGSGLHRYAWLCRLVAGLVPGVVALLVVLVLGLLLVGFRLGFLEVAGLGLVHLLQSSMGAGRGKARLPVRTDGPKLTEW